MFGFLKDAQYFTKASLTAMQIFGIDLRKSDVALDGLIESATKECRKNNFTHEEAAANCTALTFVMLADSFETVASVDYSKIVNFRSKVLQLVAQGKIREPILLKIDETIASYIKIMEKKSGTKFDIANS